MLLACLPARLPAYLYPPIDCFILPTQKVLSVALTVYSREARQKESPASASISDYLKLEIDKRSHYKSKELLTLK